MEKARLIRTVRFRAFHHYHNPQWSEEENERVFGVQGRSHAHDWSAVIHVSGTVDPSTGWCVDLGALDRALEEVMAGWEGGDLNALVPEVAAGTLRPSTEELARWLFRRIGERLPSGAALERVEMHEDATLGSAYPT